MPYVPNSPYSKRHLHHFLLNRAACLVTLHRTHNEQLYKRVWLLLMNKLTEGIDVGHHRERQSSGSICLRFVVGIEKLASKRSNTQKSDLLSK